MERRVYSGMVGEIPGEIRLDRYAAENLGLLSRSQIRGRLLEAKVNGKPVKRSRLLKTGDALEFSWLPPREENLEPEEIPLDILYEDDRTVVINKAAGMVVHPGAGNPSGTLANALLWRRPRRPGAGLETGSAAGNRVVSLRTGIVHRLDKDTSGVIAAAYDDEALAFLAAQFKARKVEKRYLALVQGTPREQTGSINVPLVRDPANRKRFVPGKSAGAGKPAPGKPAFTGYRVIRAWGDYSLILCRPRTGRTHQIRVHLRHLGHPILGDPLYGRRDGLFPGASLMLHSYSLALILPAFPGGISRFRAPPPERFKTLMAALERR
ncbi:MAG: RluA family pseudouridine synthase [Treponema sp.]|jgi:23S rRNA pseudouridine1911/1915/1917 synthase|nr:RluA family pseudouridine synthase [Treponema sp.]